MMKERFYCRGYCTTAKKWMYGYPVFWKTITGEQKVAIMVSTDEHGTFAKVEVDPESIGKYVRDVSGSPVFEGDFFYGDEGKLFVIMSADIVFIYSKALQSVETMKVKEICWLGSVVAGNVYENPSWFLNNFPDDIPVHRV